jgi:hypothetical protein
VVNVLNALAQYFGLLMNSASALVDVLSAEGYAASTNIASGSPILVLSIPPINSYYFYFF